MDPNDAILEARLARLEKANRTTKIIGATITILCFVMCMTSQSPSAPKRIDAEEIVLRDANGKVRARIGHVLQEVFQGKGKTDVVGMEVFDTKGERVAFLGALNDDPEVVLSKADTGLTLAVNQDGSGEMLIENRVTNAKALLDLKPGGSTEMLLMSKGGASAQLWLLEDGSPDLTLHSRTGGHAMLTGGMLSLSGSTGTSSAQGPSAMLKVAGADYPSLAFTDGEGRLRAVLGASVLEKSKTGEMTHRPASSLVLFDKDGKVLWSAP